MPRVPPTPFNDDAWHSARREAILKGASRAESQPLDAQRRFKLLFPPAEDDPSVAMVCNFLTDETRPAQPGDRLYMRTNFPYKPFEVSERRNASWTTLWSSTSTWLDRVCWVEGGWRRGGKESPGEGSHVPGPGVVSWPGGAMGCLGLGGGGAIKGSADKTLFICKMDAKIFSRTDKFVGFVCITGPPGGGKGTVICTLRRFGGDGRANLCHNMGATYFFDDRVRGAEDFKPVLAGLAEAAGYCDEYPNRKINLETVKPLICYLSVPGPPGCCR